MKKLCMLFCFSRGSKFKIGLKVKLLAFLMFAVLAVSAADSYSQAAKFSLKLKDATVREVFDHIEDNSEFILLYNEKWVDVNRQVDINVKNETVEKILDQTFKGTRNVYKIYDRQVVILEDEKAEIPANVQRQIVEAQMQQPQQKEITGKVSDAGGLPLPGVSVIVKGTTIGSVTNNDGEFSLNIPLNAETLQFSFVGMKTQEIPIDDRTTFAVVMEEEVIGMEEVVVVGYGTQKKVNLTGSVQSIELDGAVNAPVSNSAQLMYGRFSGVQLTQNSGLAGSDASSVVIRGIGTFGNSNPLVVIDGIQYDGLREFNQLSPSDIKNITVLKDASAGAIYGARGANGVIIVNTKGGGADGFKVELNSYTGFQRPTVVPELLDPLGFVEYINELLVTNAGDNSDAKRYSDSDIQAMIDGSNLDQFAQTDWTNEILKDAPIQNHYLSFSGGNNETDFRVSFGYLNQDAIVKGNFKYDRYNFLANINSQLNNWISITNNLSASIEKNSNPTGGSNVANTMIGRSSLPPTIPVKYSNGNYGVIDGSYYSHTPINPQSNPLKIGYLGNSETEYYNLKERFNLKLTPLRGLSFESSLSMYLIFQDHSDFSPYDEYRDWDDKIIMAGGYNKLINRFDKSYRLLNDNILKYEYIGKNDHEFSVMAGHSAMYDNSDWFNASLENFPSENLEEFNAGGVSNPAVAGSRAEVSLQSFFSRVNYVYKDRYLFEMNIRRDGSSKFAKENRYSNFPSLSLGWRVTEESFVKELINEKSLRHLKIRGSWGRTGNNRIGNYIYDQTYNAGLDYVLAGGTIVSGAALTSLANPIIKWETTEQLNIGFDASFFTGKLFLEGDFFQRRSYDVLYTNFPIPATIGVNSIAAQNSAEILNKGFELNVNYRHQGKLSYELGFNFTRMAPNEVVSLGSGVPTIGANDIITEGEPYRAFYGYQHIGIFQTEEEVNNSPVQFGDLSVGPGDLKFADISGPEGIPDGIVDANDRTVIGDPYPEWLYGFNSSISYANFDFSMVFQGIQNVDRIIRGDVVYIGGNEQANILKIYENRWTLENPSEKYIRAGGSRNNLQQLSTYYINDGSFLRLKNIELGYSIPSVLVKKFKISSLRFYMSGQNLLTFTKIENFDPERLNTNIGTNNVPIYKTLTFGVNIVF